MIPSDLTPWTRQEIVAAECLMALAFLFAVLTAAYAIAHGWDFDPKPARAEEPTPEPVVPVLPRRVQRERDAFAATIAVTRHGDRRRRWVGFDDVPPEILRWTE